MTELEVSTRVASVGMKLLPSWPVYSQIWFTQVEVQYATHDVNSQKTMFDYIIAIASLSPKFATKVCDLILKPHRNCIRTVERTTHKTYSCLRTKKTAETVQFWGVRQPQAHTVVRNKTPIVRDTPRITDGSCICKLFLQCLPANI